MQRKSRIRHPAHIALGAVLPWFDPAGNVGGVILFCAYQWLQDKSKLARGEIADSYLDVKETAITYAISAVVKSILIHQGVYL